MATDFLFSGNDIFSFTFFWKPLLQLEGDQYLKTNLISARRNRFCYFFFQILIRMEVVFRSSEIAFFKESFILSCENGFSINYKLCAFIRSLFLLVSTILEIKQKAIFFHFFHSYQRKQFFRLVKTNFLSNALLWRVETDFLVSVCLFGANFVLVETIIQIKVKPFFIE